ncbi:MAG TPA: hypothetical protein DCS12_00340 [Clostridiales bacterium]|nr:hypothetical protein [Clostridiales bacterium]
MIDFILEYYITVIYFFSYQILGVILFKISDYKDIRYLFIITDIAAIAGFLLLSTHRVLNIRNKILDYILIGITILFVFFSFIFCLQAIIKL